MTHDEAMRLIDHAWSEYMAQQDALKAKALERKARYKAAWADHIAKLHTCGMPQWKLGALCPADAYAEDERLGRNTD